MLLLPVKKIVAAGLTLLLGGLGCRDEPSDPDQPLQVSRRRFERTEFIVAEADMSRVRLRMLSHSAALHSLPDAVEVLRRRGERALLVTNGGLFHAESPIGLQVEDGRPVRSLRLGSTPPEGQKAGNFYYLPNGVLYQDHAGRVAIRESSDMRGHERSIRDGLQSGPALLLNGNVHPIARPPNRGRAHERRSAACISAPERLSIVFAPGATTFPQITRFLTELGCRDAIFLDATITGLLIPQRGIHIRTDQFGGLLVLTIPEDSAAP